MEKEAVAALHRTMRVLREELEEREATIRRLRRRKGSKKRGGAGGGGAHNLCLFTLEDASSEDHQRLVRRYQIQSRLFTLSVFLSTLI